MLRMMLAISLLICGAAKAETYVVAPGVDAAKDLQEALILAESGDIILLAEGRYPLIDGLSLDVNGATIRGA